MCDILHLYSSYVGMGAEAFFDPRRWSKDDWIALVMTWGMGAIRLAFCLGFGVGQEDEEEKAKGS